MARIRVLGANNFVYKSLSNWAFNVAVGCSHACRFCYVPSAATIKQGPKLAEYGVKDPDAEWGDYVLLRPWDEQKFLASLRSAENTPREQLKPDGNRAVIYCSTTDPYQVIRHRDPARQRELAEHARLLVRRSLELILDQSTRNVRILTRSPIARADFDLFRSFGKRLVFGMSLPTLRNDLAKVYEPKAPAPSQRLAALRAAKEAGLHVKELGIHKHLHLWPDKSLGSQALANRMANPGQYPERLEHWWYRRSEWPKQGGFDALGSCGRGMSNIWTRRWNLSGTSQTGAGCRGEA